MKKLSLIIFLMTFIVLSSCSKNKDSNHSVLTYNKEQILCLEPWNLDLRQVETSLNGKITGNHSDSLEGIFDFKEDHTSNIVISGEDTRKVFWSFQGDTLKMDNDNFLVIQLSRKRFEIKQEQQQFIPEKGSVITKIEWWMSR